MDKLNQSTAQLLFHLWRHVNFKRKKQFAVLFLLMIVASFAEVLSIGAILPFLGLLMTPEVVFNHPSASVFVRYWGFSSPQDLLFPLTVIFGALAILAGCARLILSWCSTKLSFGVGADLSLEIYRRTLFQPYTVHLARNSSEVISGVTLKANEIVYSGFMPVLTIMSSLIMSITILIGLLSIDFSVAIGAFSGFGLIYAVIIRLTRRHLLANSQRTARAAADVVKVLQEGLGGIRDVILDGTQKTFCNFYSDADLTLRHAQRDTFFVASSPRYAIEALGMVLIAALAYAMSDRSGGMGQAIPVLGTLALGAQRMLPMAQQAYASWVAIQGGRASLQNALELLDQPIPDFAVGQELKQNVFEKAIEFRQVSLWYTDNSTPAVNQINLCVQKGDRVGFIGTTGSGKSTIADIFMGLLTPTSGGVFVDNKLIDLRNLRGWQKQVAHVPQSIFLSDASIAENIAFGIPKENINFQLVRDAARQAQIDKDIESWPQQYETFVGERGVRLSGGQRQRIGIARALIKQANVIVLDEATSALDSETEDAVMAAVDGLSRDLTILIIAHRISTLKCCDWIVELEQGEIRRIYTYEQLVERIGSVS